MSASAALSRSPSAVDHSGVAGCRHAGVFAHPPRPRRSRTGDDGRWSGAAGYRRAAKEPGPRSAAAHAIRHIPQPRGEGRPRQVIPHRATRDDDDRGTRPGDGGTRHCVDDRRHCHRHSAWRHRRGVARHDRRLQRDEFRARRRIHSEFLAWSAARDRVLGRARMAAGLRARIAREPGPAGDLARSRARRDPRANDARQPARRAQRAVCTSRARAASRKLRRSAFTRCGTA